MEDKSKEIEEKDEIKEPVDFETAISLTGYGKFNCLLMLVALLACSGSMFGSTTMSFILPAAQCDLQLTNFHKGALNAVTYAGMISSAFLWGFMADNLGRHKLLVVGYFLDALFSFVSSFSQSVWFLLLMRFAVGVIVSGPYVVLMSYLAEFHGAQYRARIFMVTAVLVSMAFTIIPALAWLILPLPLSWSMFGGYVVYRAWNVFVAVCALPSLLAAILMLFFNESPKFLMSRGRRDEALAVFRSIYSVNTGKHPDTFPVKVLLDELTVNSEIPTSIGDKNMSALSSLRAAWQQTKPLFLLPHLPKALLVFSIQFFALLGMNTLRLWAPQMFATMEEFSNNPATKEMGSVSLCQMLMFNNKTSAVQETMYNSSAVMASEEVACTVYVADFEIYLNSIIIGVTCGICSFGAGYVVNAVGKRNLMIFCFVVAGACGMAFYWSRSIKVTLAILSSFQALTEVAVTLLLGIAVDIFPTQLRTMSVSLTMMSGRTGSLFGNLIFPILLDLSCEVPFFLMSVLLLSCSAASFLLPCTKGKALK